LRITLLRGVPTVQKRFGGRRPIHLDVGNPDVITSLRSRPVEGDSGQTK
jgi:hypothetical protein